MQIEEIIEALEAKVATNGICKHKNEDFLYAFSSDLMSDVLRLSTDNTILITGLCNIQTIRTIEMAEIKLVILARGKIADKNMIELADENDICVIETDFSVFKVSGILYSKGILPIY
jgi:predicted transcriptional regulator